jgi:hypothetical protein
MHLPWRSKGRSNIIIMISPVMASLVTPHGTILSPWMNEAPRNVIIFWRVAH